MDKDGLSGDVARSAPLRLGKIPLRRHKLLGVPAPLVFLPAARKVAREQPGRSQIETGMGKIGPYCDGVVVGRYRAVEPVELLQHAAAVAMRFDKVRPQRDGPVIAR